MFDSLIEHSEHMDEEWGPLRVTAASEYEKRFKKSTGVRDRGVWGDLHREELRDTVYGSEGGMREGGREEGRAHDHHSQRNRGRRR
jgi:hypothetical protein